MGRFTRNELENAFRIYRTAADQSSETGDWTIWASIFTEDATYIEHAYGEFHGRQEIEQWIVNVMKPFPHMRFPVTWHAIDEATDAVVFEVRNTLDHPTQPGTEFWFPNWTRIVYAGDGLLSHEEDIYNPARDGNRVVREWLKAGGRPATQSFLAMKYA
jgi:hypothetical protein